MLSPQLAYNATYVKANDTASNPTRGGEAAAMLMGIPAGSMGISDSYVEQDKYFGLYIADDWKVTTHPDAQSRPSLRIRIAHDRALRPRRDPLRRHHAQSP